jgi:hypothetical protein
MLCGALGALVCHGIPPESTTMFILIDNYDSFTWNLWHFLSDLGADVEIIRNDACAANDIIAKRPQGVIVSRYATRRVCLYWVFALAIRHWHVRLAVALNASTHRFMANYHVLCGHITMT